MQWTVSFCLILPCFLLTTVVHYQEPDCCLIYSSPPPSASPSVFSSLDSKQKVLDDSSIAVLFHLLLHLLIL